MKTIAIGTDSQIPSVATFTPEYTLKISQLISTHFPVFPTTQFSLAHEAITIQ